MSSKLKDKFSLDEIARGFESMRTKGEDGQVAFGGFKFTDLETVLLTSIEWDESLTDYERERINFKIPFKAGEHGKITKAALLKALHELETERFKAKLSKYIVVFTLSLRYSSFLRGVKVGDAEISFHSELPKNFDREPIRHPLYLGELEDLPERYVVACVEVSAKWVYDAYTRAQTALDILRGIWNFVLNRRTSMVTRIGGSRSKPSAINKILLGPVHTVHLPDGLLAAKEWWHNPSSETRTPEDLGGDLKKGFKVRELVSPPLSHHSLCERCNEHVASLRIRI